MNAQLTFAYMATKRAKNIAGLDPRANRLFDRNLRNPKPNHTLKLIGRQTKPLLQLSEVKAQRQLNHRYYAGSKTIAIDKIHGTLNRVTDFDYNFHPLNPSSEDRWCRVATAMMNGVDLPPIEIIQVGEEYFVKDGHHRISVAKALKFHYLDAIVEMWIEA